MATARTSQLDCRRTSGHSGARLCLVRSTSASSVAPQLGDVEGDPPRLIAGQQLGCRPAGLILAIDEGQALCLLASRTRMIGQRLALINFRPEIALRFAAIRRWCGTHLGREVWVFSSCRPPPLRSLLLSDLAECAIELPLLALLRVLLGRLARGAVRHWSAVIGERRLELFTQLSLGQLRRLWHSGPFENPRERCGQKRASE
jgi:hypothetical protein